MKNTFFTYDDIKSDYCGEYFLKPDFWWSRLYEYPFVLNMIKKDSVILDAACGSYHPFKYSLVDICKEVYACDICDLSKATVLKYTLRAFGDIIYAEKYFDKIHFNQCDLTSLIYSDNKFDYIVCISTFEHMSEDIQKLTLKEFYRVLKNNGIIILTCDYPSTVPEDIIKMAKDYKLEVEGNYNYNIPSNAISSTYFGGNLYCYNLVLKKVLGE